MNIPERYMVSLASDQFYEMRVELDEAIKAMFARMTAKNSDKGKISLTINFSTEKFEVGDLHHTRTAVMPSIRYKLGWQVDSKDSRSNDLVQVASELKAQGRDIYIVPMQEQVSLFDEEEVEVNG